MDIFVARQPIFDRNHEVYAYELLYRDSEQNYFSGNVASDVATSILLMNSFMNFGINNLVGDHKAFLNFEKALVMNDIPQLLSSHNVVIELLEDVVPDTPFMRKIQELKEKGYTIAIDDFVEGYAFENLVEQCEIIKVEFLGQSRASIEKICRYWKPKGKILLAEKVETREDYEWAKSIGFDLFQGYFFSKPSMVHTSGIQDSSANYMRLMAALHKEEPDYREIAAIIEIDAGLAYKLLKLVNSNFINPDTVSTIQHAIAMLGVRALRKWVSLAMMQVMSAKDTKQLILTSMVRSHMLEAIAESCQLKAHVEELTLLGILSILDVILKRPMVELVEELPVTPTIKNTLIGKESIYSCIYGLCLCYEQGDFGKLPGLCDSIGYNLALLPKHYVAAVKWADATYNDMYQ